MFRLFAFLAFLRLVHSAGTPRFRVAFLTFALTFSTAIGGPASAIGPTHTARAQETALTAVFDWTMPDRLGLDANGDGVVDVQANVNPSTWPVRLDACASTGPIASYQWTVESPSTATSCAAHIGFRGISKPTQEGEDP